MARYPDDPRPQVPYTFRSNRPGVSGGPEWAPQTRAQTRFGLGEVDLPYAALTWTEIKTLFDFFESVNGASGRFTFVDFQGAEDLGQIDSGVAWSGLFVAKADGVTTSWNLPTFAIKGDAAPVIYENGVAKPTLAYFGGDVFPAPGTYFITPGAGTDGVDRVALMGDVPAPAASVILTIDATCRRAFCRAKFANAKNPFTFEFAGTNSQGPVTIIEVRK